MSSILLFYLPTGNEVGLALECFRSASSESKLSIVKIGTYSDIWNSKNLWMTSMTMHLATLTFRVLTICESRTVKGQEKVDFAPTRGGW
jgi:hypothetical protein